MGWPFGYQGACGCNCGVAATLAFTVRGCATTGGPLTVAGVTVTLTQGASTLTAVTDGSGVANFSLPSTGVWNWSITPPTGYATISGTKTIVAGANTTSGTMSADTANGYCCVGCVAPTLGPITLTGDAGFILGPISAVCSTSNPFNPSGSCMASPWMLLADGFWYQFCILATGVYTMKSTTASTAGFVSQATTGATSRSCVPFAISNPGPSGGFLTSFTAS